MITPFFEADGVTVYCGDARPLLQELDFAIAGLITDPPYVNYRYACEAGFVEPFDHVKEGGWWDSVMGWYAHWLPTCVERLHGAPAFFFLDVRYLPALIRMVHLCRWAAIDYYQLSTEEFVIQCGGQQSDEASFAELLTVLRANNRYGQEKAAIVMEALVARVPRRSGVICDPFMGGGSTLIAGLKAGWPVVGIERDEATCARAVEAIKAALVTA